jgi:U2-associated protein SR140
LEKLLTKIGPEKEKFVRAVAARVQQHGAKFEEVLREREAKNEKFAFLRDVEVSPSMLRDVMSPLTSCRDSQLPEYHLYRLCADSRYRLPTPPPDDFTDEVNMGQLETHICKS